MKKTLILIFIIITLSEFSYSQLVKLQTGSIGGFLRYNFNYHYPSFTKLPEVPNCCPLFENGSGKSPSFGIFYEYFLSQSIASNFKMGYFSSNGLLSAIEPEILSVDGKGVSGEFEHTLNTTLSTIAIEPTISYKIFDKIRVAAGFNMGYLINKKYEQKEEIVKPTGVATFLDSTGKDTGKRTRNEQSGTIPNTSDIQFGIVAGVEYELPLNKENSLSFVPALSYNYGITNIVDGLKWRINNLNLSLSLKYNFYEEPVIEQKFHEAIDTIPKNYVIEQGDTIITGISRTQYDSTYSGNHALYVENYFRTDTLKKHRLIVKLKSVGADEDNEYPHALIKVEEFLSSNIHPLLNYIFFNSGSSELSQKYKMISPSDIDSFQTDKLHHNSPLDTYYQILNIIGVRMKNMPDAKIKLVGCNSNTGEEKNDLELSGRRTKVIFDYLTTVWRINPDRISLEARNLPKEPSNPDIQDGIEENQRVEITSNNWEILAPVITNDTIRTATPSIIRFYYDVNSEYGIKEWKQTAKQNKIEIREFHGSDSIPYQLDWQVNKEKESIPTKTDTLEFCFNVTDKKGITKYSYSYLPLEQITIKKKLEKRINDKKFDKYNLILFEFDKMALNPNNLRIVQIVKSGIEADSKVSVTGYTDRMGDDAYNLKLSERRAISTANEFKNVMYEKNITKKGLGETELFNNGIPEGRFYNRTVEILVETPIKW